MKVKNFNVLFALSYSLFCNVLHIRHIRAIPTYRVYRFNDYVTESWSFRTLLELHTVVDIGGYAQNLCMYHDS